MTEYDRKTFPCRNEAEMRFGILALLTTVLVAGCSGSTSHDRAAELPATPIHGEANILTGTWDSMPGATVTPAGLIIKHTGLAIVEQDGSGGQPNPPVNTLGTHLVVDGDFAVDATVKDATGPVDITLYGEPPIIADEFRLPAPAVAMELNTQAGKLTVSEWDGTSQQPVIRQTYSYDATGAPNVAMERSKDKLTFKANNKTLGSVDGHGVFNNGTVWFGMDAPQKDSQWFLAKLGVEGQGGDAVRTVDTTRFRLSKADKDSDGNGLQQLAQKRRFGFLMGAAMAPQPLARDEQYAKIAFENFGSMTPENALKWQFVHPQPDVYTLQEAQKFVDAATDNGLKVHGHTLIWAEGNPRWVNDMPTQTDADKQKVEQVMYDHIDTMEKAFGDKIEGWDVVNEPIDDDGNIRDNVWYRAMGKDYIFKALIRAHQAKPKAGTCINMYGAEQPGPIQDQLYALTKEALEKGVPLTCIGLQMHVYERGDRVTEQQLQATIEKFASLGVDVRISEIDVYSDDGQTVQAEQYADALKACLSVPRCVSYNTWGVTDRYDFWKDDDGSIQQGQDFLWDKHMKPTPAVAALQRVLTER